MGAVIVRHPRPAPFSDMRNGPPSRKVALWSHHSSDRRKASFYRVFRGIVALIVSLTAFPLFAQSPLSVFAPKAKPAPAQQTASPTPAPAPTPVRAIPLPEMANQAEELDRMLRDISRTLVPVLDGRVTDPEGKAHAAEVNQRVRQAEELLANIPNMMQLQDEERYWRALAEQNSIKRKLLTERAAGIEKQMQLLDVEQARWKATAEQVRETSGLKELAERIERELEAIQMLRTEAQERLNVILILQNRISEQDRDVSAVLLKVAEAHQSLRGRLLERDSSPLWETREMRAFDRSVTTVIYLSAGRGLTGIPGFLQANKGLLFGFVAGYVLALLAAFRFRRYVTDGKNLNVSEDASRVFVRPYSVALLITLLATIGITTSFPPGVSFVLFCLIYLVPVLRLTPGLIKPGMRKLLYALCAFYVLEWMHVILQVGAAFKRELFALLMLLAILTLSWLTRPSRLRMQSDGGRSGLLVVSIRIVLVLLAASLCANILGFFSLSQVLGVGTLFSCFTFVLLYTLVSVLDMGLAIILGSKWFQSLPDARSDVVQRRGRRILISGAFLLWLNNNLYLFTVRDTVIAAAKDVLEYPIGFGKTTLLLAER